MTEREAIIAVLAGFIGGFSGSVFNRALAAVRESQWWRHYTRRCCNCRRFLWLRRDRYSYDSCSKKCFDESIPF